MLTIQLSEIRASFWWSCTFLEHRYKDNFLYYELEAFPENTMLSPPSRKVVTKETKNRVRSTPKESSTGRISSMREHVDSQFSDSQSS
ncbi:hypothetical protein MTR_6g057695 [Medicago truncatula]|uniref:Uncharacterized protein n=1 Tax=Medicago truncatula TaxID=3880 RepID=A0A072U9G8_MEDTR|nr:hypothetical protein MTR_6g057695 [Medicago truncatula]